MKKDFINKKLKEVEAEIDFNTEEMERLLVKKNEYKNKHKHADKKRKEEIEIELEVIERDIFEAQQRKNEHIILHQQLLMELE